MTPLDQTSDGKRPNPAPKNLEQVESLHSMTEKRPVSYAPTSELCPGGQEVPMLPGGGGLDPYSLFSDVVRGLKLQALGVSPNKLQAVL